MAKMYDYQYLNTLIKKKGGVKEIAPKIGFTPSALYRKLEGERGFTQDEIVMLCRVLEVPAGQIPILFFRRVQCREKVN